MQSSEKKRKGNRRLLLLGRLAVGRLCLSCAAAMLFARSDSSRGADVGACAAVYADAWVDAVFFAFRDCARRTFVNARAASNAVVSNYVSHNDRVLIVIVSSCLFCYVFAKVEERGDVTKCLRTFFSSKCILYCEG